MNRSITARLHLAEATLLVLLAEGFGSVDHVHDGRLNLRPGAGLQAAVGVNPQLLRAEVLQHLRDALLELLLGRDTRAVDVVDTRLYLSASGRSWDLKVTYSDVAGVGLVNEDLEKLGVGLGVLDGENVSIQSGNGVEEVLEFGVAEVGVDLGGVVHTGGRELEAVDSPLQIGIALLAGAKGQTLTKSGFVDLARGSLVGWNGRRE